MGLFRDRLVLNSKPQGNSHEVYNFHIEYNVSWDDSYESYIGRDFRFSRGGVQLFCNPFPKPLILLDESTLHKFVRYCNRPWQKYGYAGEIHLIFCLVIRGGGTYPRANHPENWEGPMENVKGVDTRKLPQETDSQEKFRLTDFCSWHGIRIGNPPRLPVESVYLASVVT